MVAITKTLTLHEKAINWLVDHIQKDPHADLNYKLIIRTLSSQKEYFIKAYFIDNRYMYGSFVKEAFRIYEASI